MITKDLKICRPCFEKLWPERKPEIIHYSRKHVCEMCKRRTKFLTTIRHRPRKELINL